MHKLLPVLCFMFVLLRCSDCTCKVEDVPIQADFDIQKFTGRWFELKWRTNMPLDERLQDYQNTYYLHPDGKTLTAFEEGTDRSATPTECRYHQNEMKVGEVPGKLLYKGFGETEYKDYWVVGTDYVSYAVTYGCNDPDPNGTCPLNVTDAVVWSRTSALPAGKLATVDGILNDLCLNDSQLAVTSQDNECQVDRDCAIYNISHEVQPDFDIEKFMGVWFEESWVPYSNDPQPWLYNDFKHNYFLHQDGTTITVFISARKHTKGSADIGECEYFTTSMSTTTIPGKLAIRRKVNATAMLTSDYWIMSTDYTSYAVVYGCRQLSNTGQCEATDSWVWTRSQVFPADKEALVASVKQTLCINATEYVETQQTNECKRSNAPRQAQTSTILLLMSAAAAAYLYIIG